MKPNTPISDSPPRILLLAQPRTGSHLLQRMLGLEHQPNVHSDNNATSYREAGLLMEQLGLSLKPFIEWTDAEKDQVMGQFQLCTDTIQHRITTIEAENKTVFYKDHPQFLWRPDAKIQGPHGILDAIVPDTCHHAHAAAGNNPTMAPVEWLTSSQVILCLRHPALSFPSVLRGHVELQRKDPALWKDKPLRSWMTYSYTRALYDWYQSTASVRENSAEHSHTPNLNPILLSMNDIIDDPSLVPRLAQSLGLDVSKTQTKWDPRSVSDGERTMRTVYFRTISQSTEVMKEKAPSRVDLQAERVKWVGEFGEEDAGVLADCVERAMPDYEYLMARRMV